MEALGKAEHCLAAFSPLPNACGASIQFIGSPFLLFYGGNCQVLLGGYSSFFSIAWTLTAWRTRACWDSVFITGAQCVPRDLGLEQCCLVLI